MSFLSKILSKEKGKNDIESDVFDPENQVAVLRCSICNGEQVAGFKDKHTGHFTEVMLIKNDKDLEAFKKRYCVNELKKEF